KGSEVENQVTAYIPVDVTFIMNQVVNYAINFGTGNGGYDDGGNPIIDSKNMIQFDTKFTDWDAETPIDPTPTPTPPGPTEPKMSLIIKAAANESFALPFSMTTTTGNYTLTVDWGDKTAASVIEPGTLLSGGVKHEYAAEGEYTVTITSSETDFTKPQVPQISFSQWREKNMVKSMNTPLLNMETVSFSKLFMNCLNLETVSGDLFKYNTAATQFNEMFSGCSALTSVPEKLFAQNVDAENFASLFSGCSALKSVPEKLFVQNLKATNFGSLFTFSGITSVPEKLFAQNVAAEDLASLFNKCKSLTSVPENLFVNNTKVTSFNYLFAECTSLISVPEKLFASNREVTDFEHAFNGCSELTAIPAGLFANNKKVTSFYQTFNGCTKAEVSPNIFCNDANETERANRFSSVTEKINFEEAFKSVGSALSDDKADKGTFPTLWSYGYYNDEVTSKDCFTDAKASNAVDVTPAWGNPARPVEKPKMSFTIKTEAANHKYSLPFPKSGKTGDYKLTINWGDGSEIEPIDPGTSLFMGIHHTYVAAETYTITITSSETDYGKAQMPKVSWANDLLLKSIDTPILNTANTDFSNVFSGCLNLESIDKGSFKNNTTATNFSNAFCWCSKLDSIPADLFKDNREATDFSSAFAHSALITSIPVELFKHNTKATNFSGTFTFCSNISFIPANLFKDNTAATNFYQTFSFCDNAKVSPNIFCDDADEAERADRFSSVMKKINFTETFHSVGSALSDVSGSNFPALWDYTMPSAGVDSSSCFTGAKASNSGSVGTGWKE
ncbi:MAG: hypothetical protein ACRCZY_11295, partial [Phocaeicola sp.]